MYGSHYPLDSWFNKMKDFAFPAHLCPQCWNTAVNKYLWNDRMNGYADSLLLHYSLLV